MIVPIPITPIHSGGHLPKEILGYIILGCLAYAAWFGYIMDKCIDENWNGRIVFLMVSLPAIIVSLFLII